MNILRLNFCTAKKIQVLENSASSDGEVLQHFFFISKCQMAKEKTPQYSPQAWGCNHMIYELSMRKFCGWRFRWSEISWREKEIVPTVEWKLGGWPLHCCFPVFFIKLIHQRQQLVMVKTRLKIPSHGHQLNDNSIDLAIYCELFYHFNNSLFTVCWYIIAILKLIKAN